MTDRAPFTIEILGFEHDCPVVLDRVVGDSVYFEEAKRIGQHLLSIVEGPQPRGYRVLTNDQQLVFTWRPGDIDGNSSQTLPDTTIVR
ncbi:MAG: hypothetical protein AB1582_10520 [Pseudomonadota bacterium]